MDTTPRPVGIDAPKAHLDVGLDVGGLLDQGYRRFVLEMGYVRETGPTVLGLLTTLTRKFRQAGGGSVLANLGPSMEKFPGEMRMDAHWDIFDDAESAIASPEKRRLGSTTYE